jgi:hypothetical protein
VPYIAMALPHRVSWTTSIRAQARSCEDGLLAGDRSHRQLPAGVGSGFYRSGFCELQAVTGYRGLSRLSDGNAVRRAVVMVDPARVAALNAFVFWTLRLAHTAIVGLLACARKPTLAGYCVTDATVGVELATHEPSEPLVGRLQLAASPAGLWSSGGEER